jgi:hypothetical protein
MKGRALEQTLVHLGLLSGRLTSATLCPPLEMSRECKKSMTCLLCHSAIGCGGVCTVVSICRRVKCLN